MKICKDCQHYRKELTPAIEHLCEKSKVTLTSYVTGDVTYRYSDCGFMRKNADLCGEDAKLFEPKQPEPIKDDWLDRFMGFFFREKPTQY